MNLKSTLLIAVLMLGLPFAQADNWLTNPGFETPEKLGTGTPT